MPEPDPKHVRQIGRLSTPLERADEQRKKLSEERRALRAQVQEARREAKARAGEARSRAQTIDELIAENRRLAEELAGTREELDRLAEAAERARADLSRAAADLAEARKDLRAEQEAHGKTSSELSTLNKRAQLLEAQLSEAGLAPVLPPEQVADLVGSLLTEFRSLGGLSARESEVRLRMAMGGRGDTGAAAGFVVPGPDAPEHLRDVLHDITIRFDRGGQGG